MTRQDQLFSMNGATLIQLADKLGVKAACNKTRTQLKEKKENVVNRILEAEKKIADVKAEKQIEKAVEVKAKEVKTQPKTSVKSQATKKVDEVKTDSKFQNLCDAINSLGLICKIGNKPGYITIKQNKHRLFRLRVIRKGVIYYCNEDKIPANYDYHIVNSKGLSAVIKTSNEDYMEVFNKLIATTQNTQKEEK